MQPSIIATAATLSDRDLIRRVETLAERERQSTVELIAHLAELDRRKLYLSEGHGSLFGYCTKALHLSEQAAYKRILAARGSRKFPDLLERLAGGSLNLSTLSLLTPHLTKENHGALLAAAEGRSKREVEVLVARLAPRPDVPGSVRKLPGPPPARATPVEPPPADCADGTLRLPSPPALLEPASLVPSGATPAPATHRPVISPLTPERYRVQFTVSRETQEKLRRVQDLMRREIPDGDPAAIFDRALTVLLEAIARKKVAATPLPRPSKGIDPRSRYVPAEVKRRVWLRDSGQCAFVAWNGRRCSERSLLEFHHVDAYALGGETSASNLSLRCRAHNAYEAELVFGPRDPVAREEPARDRLPDVADRGQPHHGLRSTLPGESRV